MDYTSSFYSCTFIIKKGNKMKKTLLIISVITAAISYAPPSKADNMSLRICEYVSVNDKTRLRSFLKSKKLKVRSIFKDIQCNRQNLLEFAASSNALDVGEFIINKLPVKIVTANVENIYKHSAHLANVAKKRIK